MLLFWWVLLIWWLLVVLGFGGGFKICGFGLTIGFCLLSADLVKTWCLGWYEPKVLCFLGLLLRVFAHCLFWYFGVSLIMPLVSVFEFWVVSLLSGFGIADYLFGFECGTYLVYSGFLLFQGIWFLLCFDGLGLWFCVGWVFALLLLCWWCLCRYLGLLGCLILIVWFWCCLLNSVVDAWFLLCRLDCCLWFGLIVCLRFVVYIGCFVISLFYCVLFNWFGYLVNSVVVFPFVVLFDFDYIYFVCEFAVIVGLLLLVWYFVSVYVRMRGFMMLSWLFCG